MDGQPYGVSETVSTVHFINETDLLLHPSRAAGPFSPKSFTVTGPAKEIRSGESLFHLSRQRVNR